MAQTAMHSGNTHERQPNFRHRKKKENRKIERGEFITPPRPTGRRSKKGRVNSNSRVISTDEDPSLRIESSAIINLRGVSTKLNKYIVFTMQTYKKLKVRLTITEKLKHTRAGTHKKNH